MDSFPCSIDPRPNQINRVINSSYVIEYEMLSKSVCHTYPSHQIKYCCFFCLRRDFNGRDDIKRHLKGHLRQVNQTDDMVGYLEKWATSYLEQHETYMKHFHGFPQNISWTLRRGCPSCDMILKITDLKIDKRAQIKALERFASPVYFSRLYDHIYLHFCYVCFCSLCDQKLLNYQELEVHTKLKHGNIKPKALLPSLLPEIRHFVKYYVRACLNLPDEPLLILPKMEAQYFCVFCPEKKFVSLKTTKIHLLGHFEFRGSDSLTSQYMSKWVDHHLRFQEDLFNLNQRSPDKIVINSSEYDFHSLSIWKGCRVCELICQIYGYKRTTPPYYDITGHHPKTIDARIFQHLTNHLLLETYCSVCKFKSHKFSCVAQHVRDVHKNTCVILSSEVVFQLTNLKKRIMKEMKSKMLDKSINDQAISQNEGDILKKILSSDTIDKSRTKVNYIPVEVKGSDTESPSELSDATDGQDTFNDKRKLDSTTEPLSGHSHCPQHLDTFSNGVKGREKNQKYFCIFCSNINLISRSDAFDHLKNNHFAQETNQNNMAYLVRWSDNYLDFQEKIYSFNGSESVNLVMQMNGDLEESFKVWKGCPVCEVVCKFYNYNPNQGLYAASNDELNDHIFKHLGLKSFCFWCDFSHFDSDQVKIHSEVEHKDLVCQSLVWNSKTMLLPFKEISPKHSSTGDVGGQDLNIEICFNRK